MDKNRETFETWNRIASLYEEKFMDLPMYNESYDEFCNSLLRNDAHILEIGCGPGNVTKYLLEKRPNWEILGIDIAPNMVELAKRNNPKAQFAVLDCRDIRTIHRNFDGIIGGFCIPYLSTNEVKELLLSIQEMLVREGIVYLSFVEGEPKESGYKTGSGGRVYFYYHRLSEIILQLEELQFAEIKVFNVPYPTPESSEIHTIIMARSLRS